MMIREVVMGGSVLVMILLSGCNTQVITGEAAERLRHPYPYGARWVKEGMTRESRLADWVACGGGGDMSDGFRDWIQPETWDSFWPQKEAHSKKTWACMQSKGYDYKNPQMPGKVDECTAQTCLYP
jgi:hypothetical protein